MKPPDNTAIKSHSQVVLQRAYQVLFHLEQCTLLERSARLQFEAHTKSSENLPDILHVWSPLVAGLIIELSGALASLRILQNDVWMLAACAASARDAPSSMKDAYKKLSCKYVTGHKRPKWLTEIPTDVREAITTYWKRSGESVATYRDVDQHHDVLARGCFLLAADKGVSKVSVRLPDNPESKSRVKFTYKKEVDGLEIAQNAFSALHELVEDIARIYKAPPAPLQRTIEFVPAIEHQSGISRITALVLFDNYGRTGLVFGQDEEMRVTLRKSTI